MAEITGNKGKCIHGMPIIDKEGKVTHCKLCHREAMAAINPELLVQFLGKEAAGDLFSRDKEGRG